MSNDISKPTPNSRKPASWALIGGSSLLVVGICAITLGVVQNQGGARDEITLATQTQTPLPPAPPAAPTTAPQVTGTVKAEKTKQPGSEEEPKVRKEEPAETVTVTSAPAEGKLKAQKDENDKDKPKQAKPAKPSAIRAAVNAPYKLYNVATGKCLGSMPGGKGEHGRQLDCSESVTVRLEHTRTLNGSPVYWIRASGSGLCLDPAGPGAPAPGTLVGGKQCFDPSSTDNQEFRLEDSGKVKDGRVQYYVKSALSGHCLDVGGWVEESSSAPAGQPITILTCTPGSDQLWVFQDA